MKIKFIVLSVILFVTVMIGFTVLYPRNTHDTKQSTKVVIGYLPIIAHLPMVIAKHDGRLDGVNVEYKVFGNSNDLLQDLKKGAVDFATTVAFAPVVGAISKSADGTVDSSVRITSLSSTTRENPFDGIFVSPSGKIKTLSDLGGRKIGVFPGTTAKNILTYFLTKNGVDISKITWVYLPPKTQIIKLRDNEIDALYTYETNRTLAEMNGFFALHGSVIASILEGAPYGASAINAAFLENNPELAKKVIAAYDIGADMVFSDSSKARSLLRDELNIPDSIAQACNLERRYSAGGFKEPKNHSRIVNFIEILQQAGELNPNITSEEYAEAVLLR